MKKKILAIALIFVMAAAFCACGTEKTPASADGSADAAKGSGEEVTLYLSAAASMIELSLIHISPADFPEFLRTAVI